MTVENLILYEAAGVTEPDAADALPVPFAFVAVTLKV
jgi:hypothetical protein